MDRIAGACRQGFNRVVSSSPRPACSLTATVRPKRWPSSRCLSSASGSKAHQWWEYRRARTSKRYSETNSLHLKKTAFIGAYNSYIEVVGPDTSYAEPPRRGTFGLRFSNAGLGANFNLSLWQL